MTTAPAPSGTVPANESTRGWPEASGRPHPPIVVRESSTRVGAIAWKAAPSQGTTAGDGAEGALVPFSLVAVTVKVCGSPGFSPLIVQERPAPGAVHVRTKGPSVMPSAVTVKPVAGGPSPNGSSQCTTAPTRRA